MNKLILYGLTAVFSFMVILIIRAPANFAWQMIRDDIHVPELSIYSVGGTVWNGKTRIGFRDFPVSDLTWNLKPWPLFNGAADMEIDVKGVGHAVHSNVTLHNNTGRLNNLRGILDSEYVNQAGRRLGLQFPGELLLEKFNIVFRWRLVYRNGRFDALDRRSDVISRQYRLFFSNTAAVRWKTGSGVRFDNPGNQPSEPAIINHHTEAGRVGNCGFKSTVI